MARQSYKDLFTEEVINEIAELRARFVPLEKIAKKFGIHYNTLNKYAKENEALREALNPPAELQAQTLEAEALRGATGYFVTEEETNVHMNKDGEQSVTQITRKRWISGDSRLLKHLLICSNPERWNIANHQNNENSNGNTIVIYD